MKGGTETQSSDFVSNIFVEQEDDENWDADIDFGSDDFASEKNLLSRSQHNDYDSDGTYLDRSSVYSSLSVHSSSNTSLASPRSGFLTPSSVMDFNSASDYFDIQGDFELDSPSILSGYPTTASATIATNMDQFHDSRPFTGTITRLGKRKKAIDVAGDWDEDIELLEADLNSEMLLRSRQGIQIGETVASSMEMDDLIEWELEADWDNGIFYSGPSKDIIRGIHVEKYDEDFDFSSRMPIFELGDYFTARRREIKRSQHTADKSSDLAFEFGSILSGRTTPVRIGSPVPSARSPNTLDPGDDLELLDGIVFPDSTEGLRLLGNVMMKLNPNFASVEYGEKEDFWQGLDVEDDNVFALSRYKNSPNIKPKRIPTKIKNRELARKVMPIMAYFAPQVSKIPRLIIKPVVISSSKLELLGSSRKPPPYSPSPGTPKAAIANSINNTVSSQRHLLRKQKSVPALRNTVRVVSFEDNSPSNNSQQLSDISKQTSPSLTNSKGNGGKVSRRNTINSALSTRATRHELPPSFSTLSGQSRSVSSLRKSKDNESPSRGSIPLDFRDRNQTLKQPNSNGISMTSQNTKPSSSKSATNIRKAKRMANVGNGNELDRFDDLPVSRMLEERFMTVPKNRIPSKHKYNESMELSAFPESMHSSTTKVAYVEKSPRQHLSTPINPRDSRRRYKKKPVLIHQLGVPVSKTVNGMTFDTVKSLWEGNEVDLLAFDIICLIPPRPALISNMNSVIHSKMTQMVGTMIFDPTKMCWINSVDEEDPFTGLDEEMMNTSQDLDTIALTNLQRDTRIGTSGEFIVGSEFDLSAEFIEKLRAAEKMHWVEMKKWLPKATRERSLQNEDRFGLVRRGRTDEKNGYDYLYNICKMIES